MASLGENGPPTSIPPSPELTVEYDELKQVEVIAKGGNAVVRRAIIETSQGERTIAIKQPRFSGTISTNKIEDFSAEAKIWSNLDDNHHIVSVYDWETSPIPWLAMEYADAGSLRQITTDSRLPHKQALWVVYCVCKAVLHAHRNGVAHHDLKPANVLFQSVEGGWNIPKVSDWGLAQVLIDNEDGISGLTPQYSAPEQFSPEQFGSPDDMTDVYQVGILAYELITGRPPFEGDTSTVIEKVLNQEPPPPSEYASVPSVVDKVIISALCKKKSDRYDTIAYFRDNIKAILQSSLSGEESLDIKLDKGVDNRLIGVEQNNGQNKNKDHENKKRYNSVLSRRKTIAILGSGAAIGGGFYYSPFSNQLLNSNTLPDNTESVRLDKVYSYDFNQGSNIHSFKYKNELYFVGSSLIRVDPTGQQVEQIVELPDGEETYDFTRNGKNLYLGTAGTFGVDGIGKILKIDLDDESVNWSYSSPDHNSHIRYMDVFNGRIVAASMDDGNADKLRPTLIIMSTDGTVTNEFLNSDLGISGDIIVFDDYALIGQSATRDSKVYEFMQDSIQSASTHFNTEIAESIHKQLALENDNLYSAGSKLTNIDLSTDDILYSKDSNSNTDGVFFQLVLSNESVIVGGSTGIRAFDKRTGEQNLRIRTTETIYDAPTTVNHLVFASDGSGNVYGANLITGEKVYDYRPLDSYSHKLEEYNNTLIGYDNNSLTQFELDIV